MSNLNLTRRQIKRLQTALSITIVLVLAILFTCTVMTTKMVSDLKVMTTDELNVINEINVGVEEIKYSEVTSNEELLVYYSDVMPVEYSVFVLNTCAQYGVNPAEIFAIIEKESGFDAQAISSTGDYGLMQINKSNLPNLHEVLGTTDLLDPYQNIEAGVYWYAGIKANNHGSIEKDLMVYNMGSRGAMRDWENGIYSTGYSRAVVNLSLIHI